ncbi:hydrogenase expression/formation protein HypE [Dongia sp.]|uniref:hydrogenase expression/formation protein HypE n=1 Tax=Dongia sp. TaxID=1977262 RepID=UPI0035B0E824
MNLLRKQARVRRLDLDGRVEMIHGGGGRATAQLVADLFQHHLDDPLLCKGGDQAMLGHVPGRIVTSTDSHVVSPLFFRGGDVGSLSVHGTVNDIAMSGAVPLYLTAGFIIEEGFPLRDLDRIAASMAAAARRAGVRVVAGDTKVVQRGKGDGVFITTAGIGALADGVDLGPSRISAGDKILVSGTIGDHGVAILSQRENLEFDGDIASDSAPLGDLVQAMLAAAPQLHCLRDPTRGGLAAVLNELAQESGHAMHIREAALPVSATVAGACELIGLDPLHIANEGKLVAFCPAEVAAPLLAAMRAHELGRNASIIGEVVEQAATPVEMTTVLGGRRVVDWINGEQLPRIC